MAETITLARPYAQAIFKLAKEKSQLPAWSDTLVNLIQVTSEPVVAALIDDVNVSRADLAAVLVDVCSKEVDQQGQNLVKLLVENDRLSLLTDIAAVYEMLRAEEEGAIDAEVVTAFPLDAAMEKSIADALNAKLGKKININAVVDKSLLGGAIIRAGDLVIDGSASGKLSKLGYALNN